jgi:hypothetical protein
MVRRNSKEGGREGLSGKRKTGKKERMKKQHRIPDIP